MKKSELTSLLIIIFVLSVVVTFFVSNFAYNVKSKNVITYNSTASPYIPVVGNEPLPLP